VDLQDRRDGAALRSDHRRQYLAGPIRRELQAMTAPAFVAGQLVRIAAPGKPGDCHRGVIYSVDASNDPQHFFRYSVVVADADFGSFIHTYADHELVNIEVGFSRPESSGPDADHRAEADAILGTKPRSNGMPQGIALEGEPGSATYPEFVEQKLRIIADQLGLDDPNAPTVPDLVRRIEALEATHPDPRIGIATALMVTILEKSGKRGTIPSQEELEISAHSAMCGARYLIDFLKHS
jgi:hypothetical protein